MLSAARHSVINSQVHSTQHSLHLIIEALCSILMLKIQCSIPSTQALVLNQYSVLTSWSVPSTHDSLLNICSQHSLFKNKPSMLGTQFLALNSRCSVRRTQHAILDTRYWVCSAHYSVLTIEHWLLGSEYWVSSTEWWALNAEWWVLIAEHWVLNVEYRILSTEHWIHCKLSTHSVLSRQHSLLSTQCSALSNQCSTFRSQYSVLNTQHVQCSMLSTQ